jgi:hypothetical protein
MHRSHHRVRIVAWLATIAVILGMTGGHWLILQSVAWTKMIADYSRSSSLGTALAFTFDGQHPCEMCKLIQKEKQDSHQPHQLQQPVEKDDEVFCERCARARVDLTWSWMCAVDEGRPPSRRDRPPVPPPRRLSACS